MLIYAVFVTIIAICLFTLNLCGVILSSAFEAVADGMKTLQCFLIEFIKTFFKNFKKAKRVITNWCSVSPKKRYLIWDSWRRVQENISLNEKLLVYFGLKSNAQCNFTSLNHLISTSFDWIDIAFENLRFIKVRDNRKIILYKRLDEKRKLYNVIKIDFENNVIHSYEQMNVTEESTCREIDIALSMGINSEEARLAYLKMQKLKQRNK